MAKQPKHEDTTKETKAETTGAQTGQTLSVTTPAGGENAATLSGATDLSATIIAAMEEGKSPEGQIMVVGPKAGRWRAGRHFGPEPTIIDVADLTEEEGLALISDPRLVVGPAFPGVPS